VACGSWLGFPRSLYIDREELLFGSCQEQAPLVETCFSSPRAGKGVDNTWRQKVLLEHLETTACRQTDRQMTARMV